MFALVGAGSERFPHFPNGIGAEGKMPAIGEARRSTRSGDWKANGTGATASDEPNVNPSKDWLHAANRAMCVYRKGLNHWL
jgi:hypothetical protein